MRYSNLVAGFTKLFASIIHSTVWREDMHVKVVWVTMLAMADRNGRVFASLPGLADAARVSLPQCQEALALLSGPDQYSRTKDHEGRRISDIDGGWQLLNYLKYREARDADERRVQTREAVSRHRAKKATVSQRKPCKPKKAQAEAEAEAEAENVTDAAAPRSLSGPDWNRLAAEAYGRQFPKGSVPGAMFRACKALVVAHGWDEVSVELDAYLERVPIDFHNWTKFAAGFGRWKQAPKIRGQAATADNARVLDDFVRKIEEAIG